MNEILIQSDLKFNFDELVKKSISKFKMEVLEYALRKIANQYLRIPYEIDRVCRSVKGHSHLQALGEQLRRMIREKND